MGASSIQCTYANCYQRFDSVEAMKKHKAKMADKVDGIHDSYCKRCDEDCPDDTEYFIHQLESKKHTICPACGLEFKSEGGRNRHVSINHRKKQNLKCPACPERFTDAASMIGHIEDNKCKIIKCEDFQRHKAEIELVKEAASELNGDPYRLDLMSQSHSDPDYLGGMSLADDERAYHPDSWDTSFDPPGEVYETAQNSVTSATSQWDAERYPPLIAERATSNVGRRQYNAVQNSDDEDDAGSSDLLGSKWAMQDKGPAWSTQTFSQGAGGAQRPRQTRVSSGNLLDSMVDDDGSIATSAATRGTHPVDLASRSGVIPPAAKAENQDPNAPNAQVQVGQRLSLPPRYNLENYWNSVLGMYVCPGYKCNRKLRSVKDFELHLLSGAHAGARIKCPCCFKNFRSTQALVAHAESGSKRCELRNTENFDLAIREITGGLLKVGGHWDGLGNARFESVPVEEWNNVAW